MKITSAYFETFLSQARQLTYAIQNSINQLNTSPAVKPGKGEVYQTLMNTTGAGAICSFMFIFIKEHDCIEDHPFLKAIPFMLLIISVTLIIGNGKFNAAKALEITQSSDKCKNLLKAALERNDKPQAKKYCAQYIQLRHQQNRHEEKPLKARLTLTERKKLIDNHKYQEILQKINIAQTCLEKTADAALAQDFLTRCSQYEKACAAKIEFIRAFHHKSLHAHLFH